MLCNACGSCPFFFPNNNDGTQKSDHEKEEKKFVLQKTATERVIAKKHNAR